MNSSEVIYRDLRVGEILEEGDETWSSTLLGWETTIMPGKPVPSGYSYRRRVLLPAPEAEADIYVVIPVTSSDMSDSFSLKEAESLAKQRAESFQIDYLVLKKVATWGLDHEAKRVAH